MKFLLEYKEGETHDFVATYRIDNNAARWVVAVAEDAREAANAVMTHLRRYYPNSRRWSVEVDDVKLSLGSMSEDFDVEIDAPTQEFSSAKTSINSSKLPAVFKLVNFTEDTINLDYGGGKFDNATFFLKEQNVTNLIYDPFNRSTQHNTEVLTTVRNNGGADTATCSNVLNVIKEQEVRLSVIRNIYKLLKSNGVAYFTVYEGSGDGNGSPTSSGYQLNEKTPYYVKEIAQVFSNVQRKGKLIIAKK